jgi:aspartyl-tRNA synthetase
MISVIHPSRSRIKQSKKTTYDWRWFAGHKDFELIVSCDLDDPELEEYKKWYDGNILVSENKSSVEAINNAAKIAKGDILIVVSDDTSCCDLWDTALLKIVEGKTDWILKTQDGIQPWIITMPIMDRAYYNRFGYIYNPAYKHLFADTELTCVSDITGRKITSNLLFPHNHYSIGKSQIDGRY